MKKKPKKRVELYRTETDDGRTIWSVDLEEEVYSDLLESPCEALTLISRTTSLRAAISDALHACKYYSVPQGPNLKREFRNLNRRTKNDTLRLLCGTSAAAARRDMGL